MFVHEPVSVCGAMCGVVTVCKNEPVFVHTECVGVNLSLCVYMFAHVHILCGSEPAWAGLLVPGSLLPPGHREHSREQGNQSVERALPKFW